MESGRNAESETSGWEGARALTRLTRWKTAKEALKMPIQLNEENNGKILVVYVSGKLVKGTTSTFVPGFERLLLQHGKLRVLFDMTSFHGWEAGALWEDIQFR